MPPSKQRLSGGDTGHTIAASAQPAAAVHAGESANRAAAVPSSAAAPRPSSSSADAALTLAAELSRVLFPSGHATRAPPMAEFRRLVRLHSHATADRLHQFFWPGSNSAAHQAAAAAAEIIDLEQADPFAMSEAEVEEEDEGDSISATPTPGQRRKSITKPPTPAHRPTHHQQPRDQTVPAAAAAPFATHTPTRPSAPVTPVAAAVTPAAARLAQLDMEFDDLGLISDRGEAGNVFDEPGPSHSVKERRKSTGGPRRPWTALEEQQLRYFRAPERDWVHSRIAKTFGRSVRSVERKWANMLLASAGGATPGKKRTSLTPARRSAKKRPREENEIGEEQDGQQELDDEYALPAPHFAAAAPAAASAASSPAAAAAQPTPAASAARPAQWQLSDDAAMRTYARRELRVNGYSAEDIDKELYSEVAAREIEWTPLAHELRRSVATLTKQWQRLRNQATGDQRSILPMLINSRASVPLLPERMEIDGEDEEEHAPPQPIPQKKRPAIPKSARRRPVTEPLTQPQSDLEEEDEEEAEEEEDEEKNRSDNSEDEEYVDGADEAEPFKPKRRSVPPSSTKKRKRVISEDEDEEDMEAKESAAPAAAAAPELAAEDVVMDEVGDEDEAPAAAVASPATHLITLESDDEVALTPQQQLAQPQEEADDEDEPQRTPPKRAPKNKAAAATSAQKHAITATTTTLAPATPASKRSASTAATSPPKPASEPLPPAKAAATITPPTDVTAPKEIVSPDDNIDDADKNDDYCHLCGKSGELLICECCPRSYHEVCLMVHHAGNKAMLEGLADDQDFVCRLAHLKCTTRKQPTLRPEPPANTQVEQFEEEVNEPAEEKQPEPVPREEDQLEELTQKDRRPSAAEEKVAEEEPESPAPAAAAAADDSDSSDAEKERQRPTPAAPVRVQSSSVEQVDPDADNTSESDSDSDAPTPVRKAPVVVPLRRRRADTDSDDSDDSESEDEDEDEEEAAPKKPSDAEAAEKASDAEDAAAEADTFESQIVIPPSATSSASAPDLGMSQVSTSTHLGPSLSGSEHEDDGEDEDVVMNGQVAPATQADEVAEVTSPPEDDEVEEEVAPPSTPVSSSGVTTTSLPPLQLDALLRAHVSINWPLASLRSLHSSVCQGLGEAAVAASLVKSKLAVKSMRKRLGAAIKEAEKEQARKAEKDQRQLKQHQQPGHTSQRSQPSSQETPASQSSTHSRPTQQPQKKKRRVAH